MRWPTVSVGCVTGRPACRWWLEWNLERQRYPGRLEIVTVRAEDHPGRTVGQLRNLAHERASGEWLVWFDDDDWSHPLKVRWLVEAVRGRRWAGWTWGWIVDCQGRAKALGRWGASRVINGAAIYDLETARSVRYDDGAKASDARWLAELRRAWPRPQERKLLTDERLHSIWTVHGANVGNHYTAEGARDDLAALAARVGPQWWQDSSEQFRRLWACLA